MKQIAFVNGTIVLDGEKKIENGAILIEENKIVAIYEKPCDWQFLIDEKQVQVVDVEGQYVMPGMIDVHIHGAMGHDFIDGTQKSVDVVSENVVRDGCTSFFASLTVESHEKTCEILEGLGKATQPENGANYLGIHAEGPFLSAKYKALMIEEYLRDPNLLEFDEMLEASNGKLKYMTIAPERKGSEEMIAHALEHGVHCMVGHTDARVDDVRKAHDAGAKGFTHLYNAMSQHTHRNPGTVTGAFLMKDMYAELVCDGFHVDKDVVKVTYDAFGPKRITLITDAMLGKDMPDGPYTFSSLDCLKVGKTVTVKETGRISGSCIGMNDAIQRMQRFTGCSINDIVQMACVNPSILAQVQDTKGTLAVGKDADVIVVSKDLEVMKTMVRGKIVYDRAEG